MKKLLLIITLSFLIALPTFSANVIVDNADKVLIQQGFIDWITLTDIKKDPLKRSLF